MKKIFIALAALLIITTVQAQKNQRESKAQQHQKLEKKKKLMQGKQHVAKKLNFSDDQKKQMKDLKKDFNAKMKALKTNEAITVKEQRDKMFELKRNHQTAVQNVYNAEQKKQIADMKVKGKEKMAKSQDKRLEKMKTNLNLSDDQTTKLKATNEKLKNEMKALKENENISRTELQNKMKQLKENHKKDVESIFTKEQKEKIEERKNKKPNKDHSAK